MNNFTHVNIKMQCVEVRSLLEVSSLNKLHGNAATLQ